LCTLPGAAQAVADDDKAFDTGFRVPANTHLIAGVLPPAASEMSICVGFANRGSALIH
jgi:hypothetical protein